MKKEFKSSTFDSLNEKDKLFYQKHYKEVEKYYERNKDFINSKLDGVIDKKESYIIDVLALMQQRGVSAYKANKAELNKQTFKDQADLFKDNLMAGLRGDKKQYDKFRYAIGGSMKNFKKENLSYVGYHQYLYKNDDGSEVVISITNSPRAISVDKVIKI